MDAEKFFKALVADSKSGNGRAICSVCSSNEFVIEAALEEGKRLQRPVLIETTANQVNQFGGYMDMKPADFRQYVERIANRVGFDENMLLLGGDHLGPLVWKNENEISAMEKAHELIRQFAAAGFSKIHIDCSMHLASDNKGKNLPVETTALRTADLCRTAEEAAAGKPVYVIGSEVPIPGGATKSEEFLSVTKGEDLIRQISAFREAFSQKGLSDVWDRVIAVVVQPGVEFGDDQVFLYDHAKAEKLVNTARTISGIALEGHSTDYQPRSCLQSMARDGIAIQKVGPALTFELRSAFFALEEIEKHQYPAEPQGGYSRFSELLEKEMLANPENWSGYYQGGAHKLELMRKFSLSDRCRYYLNSEKMISAAQRLIKNVDSAELSCGLLRQYLPRQAQMLTAGEIEPSAAVFVKEAVKICLRNYE